MLLFCQHLDGIQFTIRTDNGSRKWVLNLIESTGRLARGRLLASEFEFDVVDGDSINNLPADALSRLRFKRKNTRTLGDDCQLLEINTINNLEDTQICVTDASKWNILPLDNDNAKVSLNTPSTEIQF